MQTINRIPLHTAILTLAVVLVAGCGGDDSKPTGPDGGGAADVTIDIVANNGSNSYSPNPDTVRVGQTVAWRNQHSQTHTATSNDGTTFNTGNIAPGTTSAAIPMSTPGSHPYHCTPHPSMTGTLVVEP